MKKSMSTGIDLILAAICSVFFFVRITTITEISVWIAILGGVLCSAVLFFILWRVDFLKKQVLPFQNNGLNGLLVLLLFALTTLLDPTALFLRAGTFTTHSYLIWIAKIGGGILSTIVLLSAITALSRCQFRRGSSSKIFLVVWGLLNMMVALYVAASSTVYFWDNAGFFEMAKTMSTQTMNGDFFRAIRSSMLFADYNQILAFPVSIFMRLFGTNRMVFVLTILDLYLMPGLYAVWQFLNNRVKHGSICFLMLLLLMPSVFYMTATGFVDVAAVSVGICALLIWFSNDRDAVSRGLICGVLLTVCFMLRRTFFFFAAAFGVAAVVSSLLFNRKDFRGVIAMGFSCAMSALLWMQPFLMEKVGGNSYADSYSAYAFGITKDYFLFVRYFGIIALVLAAVACLYLLWQKKTRAYAAFVGVLAVSCFVAFVSVQTHGQQHLLLYIPAFCGVMVLLFWQKDAKPAQNVMGTVMEEDAETSKPKSPWGSAVQVKKPSKMPNSTKIIYLLVGAVAVSIAVSPMVSREQPQTLSQIHTHAILPTFSYQAPVRKDMIELVRLQKKLDDLSMNKKVSVGVVASSLIVNADLIKNTAWSAHLYREEDLSNTTICYLGDVDKRDGFSWGVLDADYLVVASPVQTHLSAENQRVISYLAEDVLKRVGVGKAYSKLNDSFLLNDGVSVYIYQRNRAVTPEEKKQLEARFLKAYPQKADLFQIQ